MSHAVDPRGRRGQGAAWGLMMALLMGCAGSKGHMADEQKSNQEGALIINELPGEDIFIPDYEWPEGIAYSEREVFASRELLDANGFAWGRAGWLEAAGSSEEILREAAYLLLARAGDASDASRFRKGLDDPGHRVRVWAAWGLVRHDEARARQVLAEVAALEPRYGFQAPVVAWALLAELGDGAHLPKLASWLSRSEEPAVVSQYLYPFLQLDGADGDQAWALCASALGHAEGAVVHVALLQLESLHDHRAVPLLEVLVAEARPDHIGRRAAARLEQLKAPAPP